jgi:hypothetical protein
MRIPMLRLVAEIPATRRPWFTPQEVAIAVASGIDGKGHVQAVADGGGFVITALLHVVCSSTPRSCSQCVTDCG